MDFPIDVVQIGNKIVLIQGEITPEFIKKLDRIELLMRQNQIPRLEYRDCYDDLLEYEIRKPHHSNYNEVSFATILVDGRKEKTRKWGFSTMEIESGDFDSENAFWRLKQTIKYYKELLETV
jgi:hypothetical protein